MVTAPQMARAGILLNLAAILVIVLYAMLSEPLLDLLRPASCAATSFSRNKRQNRLESTRTGRKKRGRQDTHRLPSSDMPPPGTIQCTCG